MQKFMDQFVHFGPFKIQTQASVDFERFRNLGVRYSDPHNNFIFILKLFAKNFMHFDLLKLFSPFLFCLNIWASHFLSENIIFKPPSKCERQIFKYNFQFHKNL